MSIKGKAYIGGIFEHPLRKIDNMSVAQLHAECAKGALEDAGLTFKDVDGYFCSGDVPGLGSLSMPDYLGLTLKRLDSTDVGGSSYVYHIGHAAVGKAHSDNGAIFEVGDIGAGPLMAIGVDFSDFAHDVA